MSNTPPVLILGAGPAGLAMAALLRREDIPFRLVDQGTALGGAYARVHPELELGSPARFLALPLTPVPWPTHIGAPLIKMGEFRQYLEDYARTHEIVPEYGKCLTRVDSVGHLSYRVHFQDGETLITQNVVCATGMASFPKRASGPLPRLDRQEMALDYRGSEAYRGERVLVIGSGTSATEIATALAQGPAQEVHVLVKQHFFLLKPKIWGINIHYFLSIIEAFPPWAFRLYCEGHYRDPAIDYGFSEGVKSGRIRVHTSLESARAEEPFDVGIEAVGYRYDSAYLPQAVERRPDGNVRTRRNESVSHAGIFTLGHPCAGGRSDSKFIRGIRREAPNIVRAIKARIGSRSSPG